MRRTASALVEVLVTPTPVPVQQTATIAGALGASLLAMFSAFNAVFGPTAPVVLSRRDIAKVIAESACCWVAGLFGAFSVAPAFCLWRGITELPYVTFAGFVIGGTFWTFIPLGRYVFVKWLSAKFGVSVEIKQP